MNNVLIRGISDETLERIDTEASSLGLSRNDFLRGKLEGATAMGPGALLMTDDWDRSAATFVDLAEPEIMDTAWR